MPLSVQFAVPKGSYVPKINYPLVTVLQFAASGFALGVTSFEAAPNERVAVYNPARTVVDLMRMRHRFGEPIAHRALHRYLDSSMAKPGLLLEYAEALGVFGPMHKALDVVMAG